MAVDEAEEEELESFSLHQWQAEYVGAQINQSSAEDICWDGDEEWACQMMRYGAGCYSNVIEFREWILGNLGKHIVLEDFQDEVGELISGFYYLYEENGAGFRKKEQTSMRL